MRVTDRALQDSYLITYRNTKDRLRKIQEQLTNQSKINRPSDDPLANSKIMRLNADLDSLEMYRGNIATSLATINTSINAMSGIQQQMDGLLTTLTSIENATAGSQLDTYADQIDNVLNSILDYANTENGGNYVFGGTNYKTKPFGYNAGQTAVEVKSSDVGGEQKINISQTSTQKINIDGEDLFQVVLKQLGNLNDTTDPQTTSQTIYNADGTSSTLSLSFARDGANNYDLTYDTGSGPTVIQDLTFDATTGELQSISGNPPNGIRITDAANKLDFVYDPSNLKESGSATQLTMDVNQESDIFNTLISIRDGLRAGNRPNAKQVEMINGFNDHLIGKLSEAGNIKNRLDSTDELLENQKLDLTDLLSKEKDVDQAAAIIEMQTEEYNLNTIYRISSMVLPKSLLDYL
ncbi:MAG: flagellar hook-associated protein FlgL [Rhodothermaceae bacterium]